MRRMVCVAAAVGHFEGAHGRRDEQNEFLRSDGFMLPAFDVLVARGMVVGPVAARWRGGESGDVYIGDIV